ncbi:MAG: hypothetical protein QM778_09540 [Myxococcales bacterium]
MKQLVPVILVVLGAGSSACAGNQLQPVMASSAESTPYAVSYPADLEATRTLLAEEKTQAQSLSAGLAAQTKDLKTPLDTELALRIVDAADEAGESEGYARARAQERAVREFWEAERGPIGSRVNGAVQQKASEAKCENTEGLTSSVSYALREGVDKQLERRLRSQNEAHLLIERNKSSLGANVAPLQKLADDVTVNSYLVNNALIEDSNRISRMLSERRTVERTLDDAIEEETRPPTGPQTPAERKASAERLAELTKARDALSSAAANAEGEIKTSQEQVKTAQSEYDAALSALRDELRKLSLAR